MMFFVERSSVHACLSSFFVLSSFSLLAVRFECDMDDTAKARKAIDCKATMNHTHNRFLCSQIGIVLDGSSTRYKRGSQIAFMMKSKEPCITKQLLAVCDSRWMAKGDERKAILEASDAI